MATIYTNSKGNEIPTHSERLNPAFLSANLVSGFFYIEQSRLLFSEESYFFLMASMRKMRMKIPMDFTLDYFENQVKQLLSKYNWATGCVEIRVYPDLINPAHIHEVYQYLPHFSFKIQNEIEMDLLKELFVNSSFLSSIYCYNPENHYAEIYAQENDLDDLILLNAHKRIARSIYGNIVLIKNKCLSLVAEKEGALLSPLMEQFLMFAQKRFQYKVERRIMTPFETQQAEEIIIISERKGFNSVKKIRNQVFGNQQSKEILDLWQGSF